MRYFFHRNGRYVLVLFLSIIALSLIHWMGDSGFLRPSAVEAKITRETVNFDKFNPQIQAAMSVQDRHTRKLMATGEVVGTATGLDASGRPAILRDGHLMEKVEVRSGKDGKKFSSVQNL